MIGLKLAFEMNAYFLFYGKEETLESAQEQNLEKSLLRSRANFPWFLTAAAVAHGLIFLKDIFPPVR